MLSISEAALRLGISEQTIKNWGERGLLTLTKVGRSYCVDETHLENIKKGAPELLKQMRAAEVLRDELERTSRTYMDEIKEYKLEMMMRKESTQRINLYMEIFASLTDLIYEGRYDEREYKAMVMFLKGHPIQEIADNLGSSKQTIVTDIRKCNEILFNLQPYTKLQEENRENARKRKVSEKKLEIVQTMLTAYQENGYAFWKNLPVNDLELYLTPINSLDLSLKAKRLLYSSSYIKYLGDIIHYGERRLKNIRGLGAVAYEELKDMLLQKNLKIGQQISGWESIKKAIDVEKKKDFISEKLYEMNEETSEYLDIILQDLPEERTNEIRQLVQGIFNASQKDKEELDKYKQMCLELRKDTATMEKRLMSNDFYLLPGYDEAKQLFDQIEKRCVGAKNQDDSQKTANKAIGIFDCIFNQEALQAESQQMKNNQEKVVYLERKIKSLETKLSQKKQKQTTREADHTLAKTGDTTEVEALKAEIRSLKKEMEEMETQKKRLETCMFTDIGSNGQDKLKKIIARQEQEIKQLKFDKKSRDLTIEALCKPNGGERIVQQLEVEKIRCKELENKELLLTTELQKTKQELKDIETQLKAELLDSRQKLDETEKELAEEKKNIKIVHTSTRDDSMIDFLKQTKERELKALQSKHERDLASLKENHKRESRMSRWETEHEIRQIKHNHTMELIEIDSKHKREVLNLWSALRRYESQVDFFNRTFWLFRIWDKLEKFSDDNTKTLTHYIFEPEVEQEDAEKETAEPQKTEEEVQS